MSFCAISKRLGLNLSYSVSRGGRGKKKRLNLGWSESVDASKQRKRACDLKTHWSLRSTGTEHQLNCNVPLIKQNMNSILSWRGWASLRAGYSGCSPQPPTPGGRVDGNAQRWARVRRPEWKPQPRWLWSGSSIHNKHRSGKRDELGPKDKLPRLQSMLLKERGLPNFTRKFEHFFLDFFFCYVTTVFCGKNSKFPLIRAYNNWIK